VAFAEESNRQDIDKSLGVNLHESFPHGLKRLRGQLLDWHFAQKHQSQQVDRVV